MWKLEKPDADLLHWYESEMLSALVERVKASSLPVWLKWLLIPMYGSDTVLRRLLLADPEESYRLSERLMKSITFQTAESYPFYDMKTLRGMILKVFDYDGQISRNKGRAYHITERQGSFTCPYCNRGYVFTVTSDEDARGGVVKRIVRPHLDHWFDKADNPLLSLNIFNLIPCCPVCNSSVKGRAKFSLLTHVHPYLNESAEPGFRFVVRTEARDRGEVGLTVDIDDSRATLSEKSMIRDLCLREIYAYHGELEARDLYLWKIKNSESYLRSLTDKLQGDYRCSERDVYRMFFGVEPSGDNVLYRPFSKLKRDLLMQLELL